MKGVKIPSLSEGREYVGGKERVSQWDEDWDWEE